jgi:hypothetical protein
MHSTTLTILRVIRNMVQVVKDGRFVVLRHVQREAQHQYYQGLHQWNFEVEEGEFVIWRPRHERVHMNRVLDGAATIDCFVDYNDWLVCLITKRASREFGPPGLSRSR